MSEHKQRDAQIHSLGDQPIEEKYHAAMNAMARFIDKMFNGEDRGPNRKIGFILLVFPFEGHEGRCNYISNGANREDVITMFKEQIARFEGQADMEGHG